MSSLLLFLLSLAKLSTALYENCEECLTGVCCDDPITDIDTLICKHWSSSSGSFGAPLDVCFGRFSGVEVASQSQIYKCSADGSTVELYDYTGCSDCSCDPVQNTQFPAIFNPQLYPDRDTFNCSGPPCPYYIIEDGTAHRSGECPFDVGKNYTLGGEDYATWHVKLILEGCQSFGGTSTLLMCDSTNGILQMNFGNERCDFDPNNSGGNTDNKTLVGGVVECNKQYAGTGRAVYCSEEAKTTTTAAITTTAATTGAAATTTTTAGRTTKTGTTASGTTTLGTTTAAVTTTTGSGSVTTTTATATGSGTTTTDSATTTAAGSGSTTGSDDATTTTDAGTTASRTTKAGTTSSGGTTKAATTTAAASGDTTKADTTSSGATQAGTTNVGDTDPTAGRGYQYEAGIYILVISVLYIIMN